MRRRVTFADDRGMSLVEMVIACVVLGIMSAAVLGVILQTQAAGITNRSRIAASNLAAREIDIVRSQFFSTTTSPLAIASAGAQTNPDPLDGQTAGQPLVVDGKPYTVVRSVEWNITGSGQSACDGGSLVIYPTLGVTVSVTWPGMGSVKPVVTTTMMAPTKGDGIPGTASFVAVKVFDAAGAPNAGRTVTVTGGAETRSGLTDTSGCAVVQVNPAAGVGTPYTAQVSDPGFVDISGSNAPSKPVGTLTQGQLNNSVHFSYDRAGTVTLRIVDQNDVLVSDATAAGSQVTLVAGEFSSASGKSVHTVTQANSPLPDLLWPTDYGAYYGAVTPTYPYTSTALAPGGSLVIDVPLVMAQSSLVGVPGTGTTIVAVPSPASSCTDAGNRTVAAGSFTVTPGSWSFYATGPNFVCSPGPSAQALASGANDGITWAPTTLRVTGAPVTGTLWAVSASKVTSADRATLTSTGSCPGSAYTSVAINVDSARAAALAVAAGDWYLYLTNGAAGGTCLGVPYGQYPTNLPYGAATTFGWTIAPPTLTVTGVSRNSSVIFSTAKVSKCSASTYTTTGGATVFLVGPATSSGASLSTAVARPVSGNQTWYAYTGSSGWGGTCTLVGSASTGSFLVGPATTTLTQPVGSTNRVGP
jgi:prepilin-type N-terminal cleavage/methylation domain-containing protein